MGDLVSNRKVTLEFDVADLPMLAESLRTTACEALLENRPHARERIDRYRKMIDALIPDGARVFDGLTWSEICVEFNGAPDYAVGFEEWGYEWKKDGVGGTYGRIFVIVGSRRFSSADYKHYRDGDVLEVVASLVHQMAPLECRRIPIDDTKASHLRPRPVSKPDRDHADDQGPTWNP